MKLNLQSLCLWVVVASLVVALAISRMTTDRTLTITVPNSFYTWSVSESQIDKSPAWKKNADNPPVSARRAVLLSKEIIEKLNESSKQNSIGSWRLESMSLIRIDKDLLYPDADVKWCYLLEFFGVNIPRHFGPPYRFSAIILMDETITIGRGNTMPDFDKKMAVVFGETK